MWFKVALSLLLLTSPCLSIRMTEPPIPIHTSTNTPVEGFVDVQLNHFLAYQNETFQMRYFYNNEFNSNNIVIVVGGEWEISSAHTTGGFGYDLAKNLEAGLFATEHRFYGKSRPFNDTSVEGLKYLTVDQAMGDLAQFIQYIQSNAFENGHYVNGSVSLVGCSYAGSIVTWMRVTYPHLVNAAFSDSGPVNAQENFPEYLEVVSNAIRSQGSQECLSSIQQSMERVVALLATEGGPDRISEVFGTCTPLNVSNPMDVTTFFYEVVESFSSLVLDARPEHIPDACVVLTNSNVSDPIQRLANWVTTRPHVQPCLRTQYSELVADTRDTSYDSKHAVLRLWTYQTCVEFGWYPTTYSTGQPFLSTIPLEYFHQMCKDFFTPDFNEISLRRGIDRINLFFGQRDLPDRVITVVGGHDPWSPMGPRDYQARPYSPVHYVPGVSHCNAIGLAGYSQNEVLENVRNTALSQMQEMAKGQFLPGASPKVHGSSMLLLVGIFYILL